MPPATAFAQIDLKVNYLRPGVADGSIVRAQAAVAHRVRFLAAANAELVDGAGGQVALATGSAQILAGRAASLHDAVNDV